jgi:uncharacterized protein
VTKLTFLNRLLETLDEGKIVDVVIGIHWTAVVAEAWGERRCGLASTIGSSHKQHEITDVPHAGSLHDKPVRELAALVHSEQPVLTSVGLATINALLPPMPEQWVILNAEEVIAQRGAGKRVALVEHFPFVPRLFDRVGKLSVLEQYPRLGDIPADVAPLVLSRADVVALTSMTIHNHTLPDLLSHRNPEALVILLGPSTPLSPLLFEYGVDILCGSSVRDIAAVMRVVAQGGNFRQVHQAGVDTVTMVRPGLNEN